MLGGVGPVCQAWKVRNTVCPLQLLVREAGGCSGGGGGGDARESVAVVAGWGVVTGVALGQAQGSGILQMPVPMLPSGQLPVGHSRSGKWDR